MTPTNDAPVTVEAQDRLLFKMVVTGMVGPTKHLAIDRGGFDQDERMQYIARHRLAALASAPASQGNGYIEAFYELARMLGIGARTTSPRETWEREMRPTIERALASAPAGDGVEEVRRWSCSCDWIGCYTAQEIADHGEPSECPRCCRERLWEIEPALARPRAAVGEQSREAVRDDVSDLLRKVHWEAWKAGVFTSQDEWPDEDEQADLARGVDSVAVGEHFQGWCDDIVDKLTDRILQSPPAKVEPSTLALVIAAREFWDVHNDMSAESKALDTALEPFAATVPYANDPAVDATTPD